MINNHSNQALWSYTSAKEIAYAAQGYGAEYSELNMVRLAPGDGRLQLDWKYEGACSPDQLVYEVKLTVGAEPAAVQSHLLPGETSTFLLEGLENGIDYEVTVRALKKGSSERLAESPVRKARTGEVPGVVVNYIHPDDYTYNFSGRSTASPSLVKLPDGVLLASHDIFWGQHGQNLTKIFRSYDDGRSWSFVCDLFPCYWGFLFLHRGELYMVASSTEYGAVLISRSDDGGTTWCAPTELMPAGSREAGGPHRTPVPIIEYKGRIWTGMEYGSWTTGKHDVGVMSAPAYADLLDAASWAFTPFLTYDKDWPGTIRGGDRPQLIEGNVLITPGGELINLLRYETKGGTPDYGRAIMLNVNAEDPAAELTFRKVIDFHGNLSKFSVYYDDVTQRYISLVNRVSIANVSQRNILSLVSSANLEDWQLHVDVLNYQDNGWPEDDRKVGFQYVDWLFEGEDIIFLSRTAINGAYNYHNANHITFHTLPNFRSYLTD